MSGNHLLSNNNRIPQLRPPWTVGGRVTHGAVTGAGVHLKSKTESPANDCMDAGGRVTHGAVTEAGVHLKSKTESPASAGVHQLLSQAFNIIPNNLLFPNKSGNLQQSVFIAFYSDCNDIRVCRDID